MCSHLASVPVNFSSSSQRRLLAGATAGLAATLVMSAFMRLFQQAGMLGRMPPRIIVEKGLQLTRLRGRTQRSSRRMASVIAHLAFGTLQGSVYAGLLEVASRKRELPVSVRPSSITAVPYALLVWASSYGGWVPALGIMPGPSRDRPGRPVAMIISHLVFGVALAASLRALTSDSSRSRRDR